MTALRKRHRSHLLAVLAGAIALAWPAFFNRYPLLFPDSISYIAEGRPLAHSLFMHRIAGFAGMRSELYSLGIFAFHWNVSPWGIVALHAVLTATMLWWVIRSIAQRDTMRTFLIVVALISLLTSASWYVSLIMPDILGPAALSRHLPHRLRARTPSRKTGTHPAGDRRDRLLGRYASHATHLHAGGMPHLCFCCSCILRPLASDAFRRHFRAVGRRSLPDPHHRRRSRRSCFNAYLYGQPVARRATVVTLPYGPSYRRRHRPRLYLEQTHCAHRQNSSICGQRRPSPHQRRRIPLGRRQHLDDRRRQASSKQRPLDEEMPFVKGYRCGPIRCHNSRSHRSTSPTNSMTLASTTSTTTPGWKPRSTPPCPAPTHPTPAACRRVTPCPHTSSPPCSAG